MHAQFANFRRGLSLKDIWGYEDISYINIIYILILLKDLRIGGFEDFEDMR